MYLTGQVQLLTPRLGVPIGYGKAQGSLYEIMELVLALMGKNLLPKYTSLLKIVHSSYLKYLYITQSTNRYHDGNRH